MIAAFVIGTFVAGNVVLWTEVISRSPERGGYRPGIFEEHPMLGVAIVCAGALVAMWVHGNLV